MKNIWLLGLAIALMTACNKEEFSGYDMPFVRISTETGASSTTVLSNVRNINTYVVTLSSRPLTTPLVVNYEIKVGDGLQTGVDYELVTTGNTLIFEPGVYDMPIRIKWLPHTVDAQKDNTLTITLTGNNQNLALGLPGNANRQRVLTITKQN